MKVKPPKTYKQNLGSLLADIRVKRGITQVTLAKKIGISAMGLSHYETGIRFPNLKKLDKWAKALGLEVYVEFQVIKKL